MTPYKLYILLLLLLLLLSKLDKAVEFTVVKEMLLGFYCIYIQGVPKKERHFKYICKVASN